MFPIRVSLNQKQLIIVRLTQKNCDGEMKLTSFQVFCHAEFEFRVKITKLI